MFLGAVYFVVISTLLRMGDLEFSVGSWFGLLSGFNPYKLSCSIFVLEPLLRIGTPFGLQYNAVTSLVLNYRKNRRHIY